MTPAQPPGLTVAPHETAVLRVFALRQDDPALVAILPPHPVDAGHLAPLLGVAALDDAGIDRIDLRDLGDLTLSEFLRIGHDARSSDLESARADLDALEGHVLLIHSTAFDKAGARLMPVPGVRFLGAFRRNGAPPTPLSLPEAERPEILVPPTPVPATDGWRGAAYLLGFLGIIAILGLVFLLWWGK